jgi:hypothetical protein
MIVVTNCGELPSLPTCGEGAKVRSSLGGILYQALDASLLGEYMTGHLVERDRSPAGGWST